MTGEVAPAGALDLYHPGAEVGELPGREWGCHRLLERDHQHPVQRPGIAGRLLAGHADGETVELRTPAFRGSPGWPAGQLEIEAKAAGLLGEATAGRLLTAVGALGDGDRFDPVGLAAAAGAGSP